MRGVGPWVAAMSGRMVEILRQVGASGIVMQPSEADLANPELRPYLEKYMRGRGWSVDEKSRLFRLAWDLAADSFGMRQELYEYLHGGDITRNRTNLYLAYDRSRVVERIKEMISKPLPS
jgi:aromatic ring hydroxylase